MTLSSTDTFHLADCAARLIASERPSKGGVPFLRESPVGVLRMMWRTGDLDTRRTVAARIHIWLGTPPDQRKRAYFRITGTIRPRNGGAR